MSVRDQDIVKMQVAYLLEKLIAILHAADVRIGSFATVSTPVIGIEGQNASYPMGERGNEIKGTMMKPHACALQTVGRW